MSDDHNDQYGFWANEPTRPLERLNLRRKPAGPPPIAPTRPRNKPYEAPVVGRRQHGHTAQVPVTPAPAVFDDLDEYGGYDVPFDDRPFDNTFDDTFDERGLDEIQVAQHAAPGAGLARAARSLREATGHVDPLLRRIGVLVLLVALAIPVALASRGGGVGREALAPRDSVSPPSTAAPATESQAAPASDSPESSESSGSGNQAAAETTIDIDALPPAVPVNTPAEQTTVAAQPATEAVTQSASQPVTQVNKPAHVSATACKSYTVVGGDYWILIAQKVNVSVADLLAANNATTSTALYPGQSICLPANASAPTTAAPPTTVKATTTTVKVTTTTAAPPKNSYTRAEVEAIIRKVWPDDLENEAVRIATRESNLNPAVRNYCCYGLFQIYWNVHKSWLIPHGVTSAEQLYDPTLNAYVAYMLYLRAGGWGPWKL